MPFFVRVKQLWLKLIGAQEVNSLEDFLAAVRHSNCYEIRIAPQCIRRNGSYTWTLGFIGTLEYRICALAFAPSKVVT